MPSAGKVQYRTGIRIQLRFTQEKFNAEQKSIPVQLRLIRFNTEQKSIRLQLRFIHLHHNHNSYI